MSACTSTVGRPPGVTAVEVSENRKLGPVSATYVSQASCPTSCAHYGNGCYAEYGPLGFSTRRRNRAQRTPLALAREEAKAIGRLSGQRPLRLHVVGDARTNASARTLAHAAARYLSAVWTYTHAWRKVLRSSWGRISVLASCEKPEEVKEAHKQGYAAALIVPAFREERVHEYEGVKLLPCPAQTRGTTCAECRLCWDANRLFERGLTIGFTPHGAGKNRVSLTVLS